jgi:membrane protein implicated in regulation of membrane protease activity
MEKVYEIGQVSELAAYCIGMACMTRRSSNRWNIVFYLIIAAVLTWIVYKSIQQNSKLKSERTVQVY